MLLAGSYDGLAPTAKPRDKLSGLPNANAKSQRFSYAISQIATAPDWILKSLLMPLFLMGCFPVDFQER